jgi:hypothetical protein
LLKVPVDTSRLFDGDENYFLWIVTVATRVSETKREISEKERQEIAAAKRG